jgi:hypothetical protein
MERARSREYACLFPVSRASPFVPIAISGRPALQGSLSDPTTSATIVFSEPSEDSSEPCACQGVSGREPLKGSQNDICYADYDHTDYSQSLPQGDEQNAEFRSKYSHVIRKLMSQCSYRRCHNISQE